MLAFDSKFSFVDGLQLIVDDNVKTQAFVLGTSKCLTMIRFSRVFIFFK